MRCDKCDRLRGEELQQRQEEEEEAFADRKMRIAEDVCLVVVVIRCTRRSESSIHSS